MNTEFFQSYTPLMHRAHTLAYELLSEAGTPAKRLEKSTQLADVARALEGIAKTEVSMGN